MTEAVAQRELFDFATRLLENTGGLVDWAAPDVEGTAVVPDDVATLLHAPDETVVLSSQPRDDAVGVNLATDSLETAGAVLETKVPSIGSFQIPDRYLKGGDLHAVIDRTYTWHNARVRMGEISPARVEYHTWWFFVSLRSDDCWESYLAVTLNSESLAEIDMSNPLRLPELEPEPPGGAPSSDQEPSATYEHATAVARRKILNEAVEFFGRMDDRLARDQKRLRGYYGALQREAKQTPRRGQAVPDPKQIADKQRAVKLELRRKLAELQQQYAMEAVLQPIVLLRTSIPTLTVEMHVRRTQADRTHTIYWNSLTKQFEPLRCSACGRAGFSVAFTKGDVLPVCAACSNGI